MHSMSGGYVGAERCAVLQCLCGWLVLYLTRCNVKWRLYRMPSRHVLKQRLQHVLQLRCWVLLIHAWCGVVRHGLSYWHVLVHHWCHHY